MDNEMSYTATLVSMLRVFAKLKANNQYKTF